MPRRYLPNTDPSRIKALQKAVNMEGYKENGQLVLSYQTIRDARLILNKFRNAQSQYQQYRNQFMKINKDYKEEAHMARMYVSHFIQVLNMAIRRGELKKDIKEGYGLNPNSFVLPPLDTDSDIEKWGKSVIAGEEKRISRGGVPIYNPNIAKVKVHWSIFADHYYNVSRLKANAEKYRQELVQMRPIVDDLLHDLSNQVKNFYADYPLQQSIDKCTRFGLIFYLSSDEKKQIEAEKLQNTIEF
jgi:acyl carrier protein phosphodiesterase